MFGLDGPCCFLPIEVMDPVAAHPKELTVKAFSTLAEALLQKKKEGVDVIGSLQPIDGLPNDRHADFF